MSPLGCTIDISNLNMSKIECLIFPPILPVALPITLLLVSRIKTVKSPFISLFLYNPHPICEQIMLTIPLKYIQNLITSLLPHCCHHGPSHYHHSLDECSNLLTVLPASKLLPSVSINSSKVVTLDGSQRLCYLPQLPSALRVWAKGFTMTCKHLSEQALHRHPGSISHSLPLCHTTQSSWPPPSHQIC